jgi:hypothetical protein
MNQSPLLMYCSQPGCTTLTLGGTCVAHDPVSPPAFPRGVPFVQVQPFVMTTQREVRSRIPIG